MDAAAAATAPSPSSKFAATQPSLSNFAATQKIDSTIALSSTTPRPLRPPAYARPSPPAARKSYPSTARPSYQSSSSTDPSFNYDNNQSSYHPQQQYYPFPPQPTYGQQLPTIQPMTGIHSIPRPHTPHNAHYQKYFYSSAAAYNPLLSNQKGAVGSQGNAATNYPLAPQASASWPYPYLPDAPHRQAWSSHPTFRWFKRSSYTGVTDRWTERGGKFSRARGDNFYRPLSLEEQREVNEKIRRRIQTRGYPRLGEW